MEVEAVEHGDVPPGLVAEDDLLEPDLAGRSDRCGRGQKHRVGGSTISGSVASTACTRWAEADARCALAMICRAMRSGQMSRPM